LLEHVRAISEPFDTVVRYVHHIARFAAGDTKKALLTFLKSRSGEGLTSRAALVRAIQQGAQERGEAPSDEFKALASELAKALLSSARGEEIVLGINLASSIPLRELRGRLEELVNDAKAGQAQRAEAISALVGMDPKATLGLLGLILSNASAPDGLRERAIAALSAIDQPEARTELVNVLPTAPNRLQTTIAASLAARKSGGEALLQAITAGKASARLLQEQRVMAPLTNAGVPNLKDRVAGLLKGLPPADQRLNDLIARRRAGFGKSPRDAAIGAKVFEKNCAICHQMGGKGARIGPQLDGVGLRGADRLLEDLLDPNRNVDQAFRVTNLALNDGRIVSGLLLKEEGAVLVLADAQGKEVRIPKENVEERTIAQLSPMPANFAEQVSESEFYDLLAYLLSQQQNAKTP
jgi:putative heme-binding domain-containing protein